MLVTRTLTPLALSLVVAASAPAGPTIRAASRPAKPAATQPAAPQPAATQPADDKAAIVGKLVEAYGLDRWRDVKTIAFTFNVKKGERRIARSWKWELVENRVTLTEGDSSTTYDRDDDIARRSVPKKEHLAIDAKFINDSFWMLLPLHLSWSDEVQIKDGGMKPLPIGEGKAREIVVTYPKVGKGYTPGDLYKLYVNDAWRITQWTFHRGGAKSPSLKAAWVEPKQVGPLHLNTRFTWRDGKFELWFSDVAVTSE